MNEEQPITKPKATRKVTDLATVKRGLKALGWDYELTTTEYSDGSKVIKLSVYNTFASAIWLFNDSGSIADVLQGDK